MKGEEKKAKMKDTTEPTAPWENDGARAASLCLIRPHWGPAGDDNTQLLKQHDK